MRDETLLRKQSRMILFIDDDINELIMLRALLKAHIPDVFIYWMAYLSNGKSLLSSKLYDFDMVVIDVSGVTLGCFPEEVKGITGENIVISSSILAPITMETGNRFILKENLSDHILKFYGKK